ncbi:FecR family protein [Chitinophaga arvensicola]|uniref:Ferric-dicitrate binding protein FerR, regulates iron transport through sigma-19 n=1 Tax=Chitinophaga arvensicola TaxID=29529 RepID=A0A1I0NDG2_9BACT|nr:FecR domain-containing protein [Chitinophaga arvensicola]SEV99440.1 ferric-dicitrate binding protein FerR, regulates iron transport through sigma-19 [Chitinophaga arvensicola]
MESNYHLFTKEEFLEDAFFQEWVKYATPAATAFWTGYRDSVPPNIEAFQQAIAALEAILSLERITPPAGMKALVWQKIQEELQAARVVPLTRNRRWYKVAAVLVPLIAISAWWLFRPERMNTVISGYGQQVRVLLPDSSVVVLNAHSELRYNNWKDGKREVWLQGEALFDVHHRITPVAGHFTVHAGKVQIEVLGTTFNVKERREQVVIYLKEGKVKVTTAKSALVLQPEEQAVYDGVGGLQKVPAKKEMVLAWTAHKMQLQHTAVKDIINTLHDIYGFTIMLEDTAIANRTIDGVLPLKNVNNVLFELSAILNVKIEKSNDTLTFKSTGQQGY